MSQESLKESGSVLVQMSNLPPSFVYAAALAPHFPETQARAPPPHGRTIIVLLQPRRPMPLGTFVTLLAAAASSNDPCTAQCRQHTCASFNSSLSCSELRELGCGCVSPRLGLKPPFLARQHASRLSRHHPFVHRAAAALTCWRPSRRPPHQRLQLLRVHQSHRRCHLRCRRRHRHRRPHRPHRRHRRSPPWYPRR